MRFRWEGWRKASYGLINFAFYAFLIALAASVLGSNAVGQFISLVLRALVGGTLLVLGMTVASLCGKQTLRANALPTLSEVRDAPLAL